ncbi:MAG TPA: nuclear transport factor 2 family protein [Bryobacteraceae bacterium]|jgi:hypothetical protein
MCERVIHTLDINDLLARFFQAYDDKDWQTMQNCLCDEVFADYSSFRDAPAARMSGAQYVEQRRKAFDPLHMQHDFTNLRVELDPDGRSATARCNYAVHRFLPSLDGIEGHCHAYGRYFFGLANVYGEWRISWIIQNVVHFNGNRDSHGAVGSYRAD